MRLQLLHTFIVCVIAAIAGWIGLNMLTPGAAHGWALEWTIAGSVFIWLLFGNLFLHTDRSIGSAVYIGLLSPLLGSLLVIPPWSFFIVFSKPFLSFGLGVLTSLFVWGCSRRLAAAI